MTASESFIKTFGNRKSPEVIAKLRAHQEAFERGFKAMTAVCDGDEELALTYLGKTTQVSCGKAIDAFVSSLAMANEVLKESAKETRFRDAIKNPETVEMVLKWASDDRRKLWNQLEIVGSEQEAFETYLSEIMVADDLVRFANETWRDNDRNTTANSGSGSAGVQAGKSKDGTGTPTSVENMGGPDTVRG